MSSVRESHMPTFTAVPVTMTEIHSQPKCISNSLLAGEWVKTTRELFLTRNRVPSFVRMQSALR